MHAPESYGPLGTPHTKDLTGSRLNEILRGLCCPTFSLILGHRGCRTILLGLVSKIAGIDILAEIMVKMSVNMMIPST